MKKGDPLLEIFSPDLAAAKGGRDGARPACSRQECPQEQGLSRQVGSLPLKDLLDAQNDEAKSSLQVKLARASLRPGPAARELDKIAEEGGTQRARITLHSPVDGIVIKRNVVLGNYYKPKDELMQISPLDPMNVTAAISENFLDRIHPGQDILVAPVVITSSRPRCSPSTRWPTLKPGPFSSGPRCPTRIIA